MPPRKPPLVLVVDDVAGNRILAEAMLTRLGWSVVLVDSGQAALDFIATERPDAMLIDVRMPGIRGDVLAGMLRSQPGTRTLRLVGYTAHALPHELATLRDCGFDHVLVKPVMFAELKEVFPLPDGGRQLQEAGDD